MMEEELDLRRYFAIARRWLWLIAGCALLAAVSAYVVSSQQVPMYTATMTLVVGSPATMSAGNYNAVYMNERVARTYTKMLKELPVMDEVIAELGLNMSPSGLAGRVTATVVEDTQLIRLDVRDTDPDRAKQIADTVAVVFILQNEAMRGETYSGSLYNVQAQMDELLRMIERTQAQMDELGTPETAEDETRLAQLESILAEYHSTYATLLQSYEQMRMTATQFDGALSIFREARVLGGPSGRNTTRDAALGGAVGAMLGLGVAFLIEYLDDTLKTPEDVSHALGLGTLATVGQLKKGDGELVVADQPLAPVSEAFRVLRTNIRFSSLDSPLRTILVTSAGPTEGKSITVANLAVAMAQSGLKVVVVDGDLRRPRLHQLFDLHPHEGLTGALLEGEMDGRLQPSRVEGLAVLPAGGQPPNPTEMLGSQRMRDLLGELTQQADVVLIDSPPVLPVADAVTLVQSVDGVLLVVDAGETRRGAAKRAVQSLRQAGANLVGVVLNAVPSRGGGYYYNYYYYQGHYGDENGKRQRRRRRQKGTLGTVRRLLGRTSHHERTEGIRQEGG